jgi:hypothetical protein
MEVHCLNYVEIYSNHFNVIGPGGQHRSLMIAQGLYAYHNYKVLLITPKFKAYYESVISRPQDFLEEGTLNNSSLQKLKACLTNGLALPPKGSFRLAGHNSDSMSCC